ncbi:helix-turn-helix domain-containing protein [Flavihumibacter petaseus]|uniref:Putative ATPase n=1 Tax=Flavihumibacter petaseus NBRC 106054 TaxID=1220578 RepID=A0A0E9MY79_9BACT|nr:helix-turn-helix domain-containing protein [Flavihumibacter petaseus]GAO42366.1 putative ATPase [Flavihumibacter petaseus NBRC 106054]
MKPDEINPAFDIAVRFVLHTKRNLFLTGKAGTGKTTFLKHILGRHEKKTVVVAPTGVAAINAGGVTLHTFFQLPMGAFAPGYELPDAGHILFNNQQTLLSNLRLNSTKRELMQEMELLVIDEVSMLRADTLDAIDCILRYVRRQPREPFGGVQVLFIGDLYQLPPVISDAEWESLKTYYNSPFFFDARVLKDTPLQVIELTRIYRQQEQLFIDLLNKVRNNSITAVELQQLNARCNIPRLPEAGATRPITLTTHNAIAESLNLKELNALPEMVKEYDAVITGEFSDKAYPAEQVLKLKVGAQVMITRNDKGEDRRYYNGKIGRIRAFREKGIEIEFPGSYDTLLLEKETWRNLRFRFNRVLNQVEEEELGTFTQYPVRLAWAITIHKSQGLTFESAEVDAGAAFAAGQVYVALSRLTRLDGLYLRRPIAANAISTDGRIVAYSNTFPDPESVASVLPEAEKWFIADKVFAAFRFETLAEQARLWITGEGDYKKYPVGEKATLPVLFSEQLNHLATVGRKTVTHLDTQFNLGQVQGFETMGERIYAAIGYFNPLLKNLLEQLYTEAKSVPDGKKGKQQKLVLVMWEELLLRRVSAMEQARKIADALVAAIPAAAILAMVEQSEAVKGVLSDENAGSASTKKSGSKKGTKKHVAGGNNDDPTGEKVPSAWMTLALFMGGKSMEDIATTRELALSTVAGHLVEAVEANKLSAADLVSVEKIVLIRQAITGSGAKSLKELKAVLSDEIEYYEIRAVLADKKISDSI